MKVIPPRLARRRVVPSLGVAFGLLLAACSSAHTATPASVPSTSGTAGGAGSVTTSTASAASAPDANAPESAVPGDIPDNQVFVAYAQPAGGYTIKVPEGWARTEGAGVVQFKDNYNGIRLEAKDAAVAPTPSSAQAEDVPALTTSVEGFQLGAVTTVHRSAGDAVLITYKATSKPNAVTGKALRLDVERYEFWHNGRQVILTLSAAEGSDNVDPWKTVTDSLTWT